MIGMINTDSSDTSMDIVTLGERGQVVVPAAIRERLGLSAGDRLMVFTKHSEVICLVPASSMRHLVNVLNSQIAEMDDELSPTQETA
jgi:AbrB family looped-hinge helix DNA binding protein